jgi:beta-glucosidase
VAIVFVNQPMSEGRDAATLTLPDKQDDLVSAVAAANAHTIVVAETGGPVTMPWAGQVSGILEAWFPGIGGGPAIANILFGDVNPSAKLPVTFAKSDNDLPHAQVPGINLVPPPAAGRGAGGGGGRGGMPPFAFGHGLSYTTFAYSGLRATTAGHSVTVSFSVKNGGKRAGKEIAEVYASLPASTSEPPKRLIGWQKVELAAGESKTINLIIDPPYLPVFNEGKNSFEVAGGDYKIWAGGSSRSLPLSQAVQVGN